MSTYAIGDIQGCYDDLQRLIEKIKFDPAQDQLWFAGDLVNRGPKSLETLRFIRSLDNAAICVLGNHDLHLLALAADHPKFSKKKTTLHKILDAPDAQELIDWLRHQKIMHSDKTLNFHMAHAGIYPLWKISTAKKRAKKLEKVLQGNDYQDFILEMYGNKPSLWRKDLSDIDKLRFTVNSFTRMRFIHSDGRLDFKHNGNIGSQPKKLIPWFAYKKRQQKRIVFGHWSSLSPIKNGKTYGIDSGCLWGGKLTALSLENPKQKTTIHC